MYACTISYSKHVDRVRLHSLLLSSNHSTVCFRENIISEAAAAYERRMGNRIAARIFIASAAAQSTSSGDNERDCSVRRNSYESENI
jgi:hypothetical protein